MARHASESELQTGWHDEKLGGTSSGWLHCRWSGSVKPIEEAIRVIETIPETHFFPGIAEVPMVAVDDRKNLKLPDAHVSLLRLTNGVSGYGGYFRLFGFRCGSWIDL